MRYFHNDNDGGGNGSVALWEMVDASSSGGGGAIVARSNPSWPQVTDERDIV